MTANNKNELIVGMFLFSVFGLMVETLFTGILAAWSGSFKGGVSLLMIPVYSLSYCLGFYSLEYIEKTILFRVYFRLPMIVIVVYIIEWVFGAFYKSIGLLPWHYQHGWASDFSNGNITLYFLPAWLLFAFIVVPVIKIIRKLSPVLIQQLKSELINKY
jgi:hypothetical protein